MSQGNDNPSTPGKARKRRPTFCVLVVDQDCGTAAALNQAIAQLAGRRVKVIEAASVTEARRRLTKEPIGLVVVAAGVSRGRGLRLAEEIAGRRSPTQTIVLTERPTLDDAVAAIRAGASDFIRKPLDLGELSERVSRAIERHEAETKKAIRVRKLRRACQKLSAARDEVSQQVDILCNDLVSAYQELADQMHQVVETSEFAALLRKELDLERLLHQTLEYLLEKAGPTNAAVFLPVTGDEYTLGGYVNYDCADGSPEILLNHLADVVAPAVAEEEVAYHITDNTMLVEWLGDDANYLQDCHMLAVPCWAEGEALAVVVLFRDASQPYTEDLVGTTTSIAPMLGQYLAKIIRIHHRHSADFGEAV